MTQVGPSLRATGDNEAILEVSKVSNTDAMKYLVFTLQSLVAFQALYMHSTI